MAAAKPSANLYVRRSLVQRIKDGLRAVLRLPRYAWTSYLQWPKRFRYLITGVAALALVGAAVAGGMLYQKRADEHSVQRHRYYVEDELRKAQSDRQKLLNYLGVILDIVPNDTQALSRKKAIETGEGNDPGDAIIMQYLFREHLRANRTDELIRECRRRLDKVPQDYEAHYHLANVLLAKNDAAGAEPHLAAIADPFVNQVNINFGPIAGALQILQQRGRDASKIRAFVGERIVPLVKSVGILESDNVTQLMVLYLYSETFALPKIPSDSALAWPYVAALFDECLKGSKAECVANAGDPAKLASALNVMRNLGGTGAKYIAALAQMKAANQLTEPQRAEFAATLETRIQDIWNFVLTRDAKMAEAYVGLVESYSRTGDGRKAIDTLVAGLDACGDQPQLLGMFSRLSILNAREMAAYERLKLAAERNPKMPVYWLLAAQAAASADRRDLAVEALSKAREIAPKEAEILVMQAALLTGTGYPEKVLASLAPLPDAELVAMPRALTILVRAVAEVGDGERVDYLLETARTLAGEKNSPVPIYSAALGFYDAAPPSPERAARVAEYVEPALQRWRMELRELSLLHAAALVRVAELKPGPLDAVAARNAILACERSLTLDPNHAPTAANLANLRIRSEKNPLRALDDINPLLARLNDLTPEQAEVLALVFNANKRFDDAVRVLNSATPGRKTAGCMIQLAVAYFGQGRADEAETALRGATQLPMSDREQADYQAARDLLSRVKP